MRYELPSAREEIEQFRSLLNDEDKRRGDEYEELEPDEDDIIRELARQAVKEAKPRNAENKDQPDSKDVKKTDEQIDDGNKKNEAVNLKEGRGTGEEKLGAEGKKAEGENEPKTEEELKVEESNKKGRVSTEKRSEMGENKSIPEDKGIKEEYVRAAGGERHKGDEKQKTDENLKSENGNQKSKVEKERNENLQAAEEPKTEGKEDMSVVGDEKRKAEKTSLAQDEQQRPKVEKPAEVKPKPGGKTLINEEKMKADRETTKSEGNKIGVTLVGSADGKEMSTAPAAVANKGDKNPENADHLAVVTPAGPTVREDLQGSSARAIDADAVEASTKKDTKDEKPKEKKKKGWFS